MATIVKESPSAAVEIQRIQRAQITLHIVGTRPLILNRMAEKARRELLAPRGRLTAAAKQANVKHDPVREYRASPNTITDPDAPAYLAIMASAFKGAMATAALDIPGAKKAQIGRLVWVEGDYIPIWGVPRLMMAVTRSADMNRTPDIRTRAIVPQWACRLDISFVQPLLNTQAVFNLLYAAGLTVGVGDWRPEKGKGTYGQFTVVNEDDAQYQEIIHGGGRAAQLAAMESPEPYDAETAELLAWWQAEMKRRGVDTEPAGKARGL